MLALLNQAEFYFERDLNVTFNVVSTFIWITDFPSTVIFASAEFNESYGSYWYSRERDMIHLFSGKLYGSQGEGETKSLCVNPCHAVSHHRQDSVFTTYPTNYELHLMTHEIGHVFGGTHVTDKSFMHDLSPGDDDWSLSFSQFSINEIQTHLNAHLGCGSNDLFSLVGPSLFVAAML